MESMVKIPSLGESITEATISRWLKADGDWVDPDEAICELETDKANVELPAPVAGKIRRLKTEKETVHIGESIAAIDQVESEKERPSSEKKVEPPKPHLTLFRKKPDEEKIVEEVERPQATEESRGEVRRAPLSKIRKKIAERLVAAQHEAAILTTFNEVDMSEVLALKQKYQYEFQKLHGVALGLMPFFVKATVQSLQEFPILNASLDADDVLYHKSINMGIAVSTEKGLVVPVLHQVERMPFDKIQSEIRRLSEAARLGKLSVEALSGGTFTITNGGVFGSLLSTPILNPPQVGILGMHAIVQRPRVMKNGTIEPRPMMYLALSYDHRLVDGQPAVQFLVRTRDLLEEPSRFFLLS
ncbi:MAG: 2-oxo acid dehydrogenase subunit E2 [Deltaproteobacteria bacterium]|nr:2-oxo acid dehydrogenase subunit E2 [Deltaproteobacteria bacterium]